MIDTICIKRNLNNPRFLSLLLLPLPDGAGDVHLLAEDLVGEAAVHRGHGPHAAHQALVLHARPPGGRLLGRGDRSPEQATLNTRQSQHASQQFIVATLPVFH